MCVCVIVNPFNQGIYIIGIHNYSLRFFQGMYMMPDSLRGYNYVHIYSLIIQPYYHSIYIHIYIACMQVSLNFI